MARAKITIYKNDAGEIYRVIVAHGTDKTEFPVTNSSEKMIVRTMRELFGGCDIETVQIFPMRDGDDFQYTPELRRRLNEE